MNNRTTVLWALILVIGVGGVSEAQDQNQKLPYSVLSSDRDGRTQFRDEYLSWNPSGTSQA